MSVREAVDGPDEAAAAEPVRAPGDAADAARSPHELPVGYPASRRPWIAGALGATWALFVGLALLSCLVMAVWALSPLPAGDSGAAWRAVGLAWLAAHQTALTISGLPVTVLPLGAVLPALLLTRRGGRWAARLVPDPSVSELAAMLGGACLVYGAGGAGVAWLSATASTGASLRDAFLAGAAVAAVGSMWGIARESGLALRVAGHLPPRIWRTLVAGSAGALGLFVLGAGLVTLSLVVHVGDAFAALSAIDGGLLALAGVTLVNVLTLPTLAIWGAAFATGPGFSLGQLGSLSAFGGEVGALPALPVLVAIPSSAPAWAPVLLLGPLACGVLAGRVRWQDDVPSWPAALMTAVGVGLVTAPFVAGGVALTSGSLGGGALAQIGPELGPVTAAAAGLVALGFLGEAVAQSLRMSWELHQAQKRPDAAMGSGEAPAQAELSTAAESLPGPGSGDTADGTPADASVVAPSGRRSLASSVVGVGSAARSRVVWAATAAAGQVQGVAAVVGVTRQGQAEPASEDGQAGGDESASQVGQAGGDEPGSQVGQAGGDEPGSQVGQAGGDEPASQDGQAGEPGLDSPAEPASQLTPTPRHIATSEAPPP